MEKNVEEQIKLLKDEVKFTKLKLQRIDDWLTDLEDMLN